MGAAVCPGGQGICAVCTSTTQGRIVVVQPLCRQALPRGRARCSLVGLLLPKDCLSKNCHHCSSMAGYHQAIRRACSYRELRLIACYVRSRISHESTDLSHRRYFTTNCHNHTTIHSQCVDGGTPPSRQTANSKRWQQQKVIIPFVSPWIEQPDCLARFRIPCDSAC